MKRWSLPIVLLVLLSACQSQPAGTPKTPAPAQPAASSGALTPVIPTPVPNTLTIDPEIDLGPISPYIFGSNYGPWTSVPPGMFDYAVNSQVKALRFPGGNWGDQNDIQTYHLDLFITICEKIGAIPTVSVRLLNGSPEAAANLVKYANIEMGYKIRYWSIGNEPDLFEGQPNVDYDTVRFNREWRAIAVAMKAVDPSILLLGPELSGGYTSNYAGNPKDTSGRDWMTEFLKANGDMTDVVTYHRYPFPVANSRETVTIDQLRQDPPEWNRTVQYLRGLIHETTGRDIPIAITEAGANSAPVVQREASPDSFYNAIWWADVLGRSIDENVFMVNQFLWTQATGQSGGWGLITISGVRPTYYVYQMYSHFGVENVLANSGIQDVTVYAAKQTDGSLTIMVINLSDSDTKVPVVVRGTSPGQARTWLFDKTHNAEDLGQQPFSPDGMLDLPAQSISLYQVLK
jgi:hypothetical protein